VARLLALLLDCCPREFREAYGRDILELFETRRSRLHAAPLPVLHLWCVTALDICATAAAEWADELRSSRNGDARRVTMSDRLMLDLRDAFRRLAGAPGFTTGALLLLALGIGLSTAIFTAVDAFALRDLPFERPSELVHIYQDGDEGRPSSNSYPAFLDIAAHDSLFTAVGAVVPEINGTLLSPSGDAETVHLEFATSSYFPTLGLRPKLGRWFAPVEDTPGAPAVAVLTHRAWERRFASDPAVLGRTLHISGAPVTIVGVGPAGYSGFVPGLASEAWLSMSGLGPVGGAFRGRTLTRREDHWFQVVARLAPGRTVQQAQGAMDALADRFEREFPETDRGRRITVMSRRDVRIHPDIDAMVRPVATLQLVLAALVLALVCSNLANLTLARGSARTREVAVRLAIGATRTQIVRSLVLESLVLALAGGALGSLLARSAVGMLGNWSAPPPLSAATAFAVDGRAWLFAFLVSLCTGVAFGLLPAIRSTASNLRSSLHRDPFRSLRIFSFRGPLIGIQVAVSVAFLAGSGILLRSLLNAIRIDPGFDPAPLALMTVDSGQGGRPLPQAIRILTDLHERALSLPGVEAAALTTRPPVTAFGPSTTLVLDEHAGEDASGARTVEVRFAAVTPGYFRTLGIPLLHGRDFAEADRNDTARVAVVSQAMAERFWGTTDVIGRRYRHEGDPDSWVTVVGVVRDVTIESPGESAGTFFYRPFSQGGYSRATLVARTVSPPASILPLLRLEARDIDSQLPVTLASTMPDHIVRSMAIPRVAASVLTSVGGLAVLLASLGIYSVVAFSVARRRGEMGVRMALGATGQQVTRMVVGEMMKLVLVGLLSGTVLAAIIAPALRSLLVGLQPLDAGTFIGVFALVATVALLTTWIPARRAAHADLAGVLRAE
jgi:predicted permease